MSGVYQILYQFNTWVTFRIHIMFMFMFLGKIVPFKNSNTCLIDSRRIYVSYVSNITQSAAPQQNEFLVISHYLGPSSFIIRCSMYILHPASYVLFHMSCVLLCMSCVICPHQGIWSFSLVYNFVEMLSDLLLLPCSKKTLSWKISCLRCIWLDWDSGEELFYGRLSLSLQSGLLHMLQALQSFKVLSTDVLTFWRMYLYWNHISL